MPLLRRTAVALLLTAAIALGASQPAAAGPDERAVHRSGASIRAYWTPERMAAALPALAPAPAGADANGTPDDGEPPSFVPPAGEGAPELRRGIATAGIEPVRAEPAAAKLKRREVADPSAPNVRAHGKVFFTTRRGGTARDWVCSGTAVNSRNRSVVWTAGHCVFDRRSGTGFVSNWTFVPGYHEGEAPFGRWPARRLATTRQWRRKANLGFDLGAAVVRRNADRRRLQGVVGARGIAFNQRARQQYAAFGYPQVELPTEPGVFTGEREFRCASKLRGRDATPGRAPAAMRLRCDMTAGSSGGGWVAKRTVLSVTSYLRNHDPGFLYGPYMANAAKRLYQSVRGKRHPRKKRHRGGKGNRKRISGGVLPPRPRR